MGRKGKTRKLNAKVLVLCEGETERNYLLEIKGSLPREKQRGIQVDIQTHKQPQPINLVREAVRRKGKASKEGAPYDTIWVAFDHDNLPNRETAFRKADQAGIEVAFSSLNIEVWFLLHFQYTTRPFSDGETVKKLLGQEYIPGYDPSNTRLLPILQSREATANQHAKRLKEAQKMELDNGTGVWDLNPYVTMDLLVQFIRDLAK